MKSFWIMILSLIALVAAPMMASATVPSGELDKICAAGSPVCMSYSLGAAERFWLMNRKTDKCDTKKDGATLKSFMQSLPGPKNLYAGKEKTSTASVTLLSHLVKNKINVCTPVTRFSELLTQCDSKEVKQQNTCQSYITGVLDMALTLHEIVQIKKSATDKNAIVAPFCEGGKPKLKMVEGEVKRAIAEWRKARPDRPSKMPAALEIINALAVKYPCSTNNIIKQ